MTRISDVDDVKLMVFDLMGTCTDWETTITSAMELCEPLRNVLSSGQREKLAAAWRRGFFAEIHRMFDQGLPGEEIDLTHRRVLDQMLDEWGISNQVIGEEHRERLVQSWHKQSATKPAWPDSIDAIKHLMNKFIVVVLANGTTRLQLDIIKSSGLHFHTLFSSQLLGLTKPSPEIYLKTLSLVGVEPQQSIMVAAHAYDLRAAKKVGMQTVYIRRETEDPEEDMAAVKDEVDYFVDGANPLAKLASLLK